jgi:hypothetical protein
LTSTPANSICFLLSPSMHVVNPVQKHPHNVFARRIMRFRQPVPTPHEIADRNLESSRKPGYTYRDDRAGCSDPHDIQGLPRTTSRAGPYSRTASRHWISTARLLRSSRRGGARAGSPKAGAAGSEPTAYRCRAGPTAGHPSRRRVKRRPVLPPVTEVRSRFLAILSI